MKSFHIFKCNKFPETKDLSLEDVTKDGNLFGSRELRTAFRVVSNSYHGFVYLEVEHSFEQNTAGRAMSFVEGEYKEFNFSEYVEDKIFNAYYHEEERILIFETRKEIAKDIFKNISTKDKFKEIELEQKILDFEKLEPLITEYNSIWFSGIKSGGLKSANLTGSNLKDHPHYSDYKKSGGTPSYITVPFEHQGAMHSIGITKDSGVILHQRYDNIATELRIILEVYSKFFKEIWDKDSDTAEEKEGKGA